MKRILRIFSVIIIAVSLASFMPSKSSAQGAAVSFQVFYDNLSPYGQWVNYPDNGYAWIPNADANFSPYATNGYWQMTDYGWTWVSNYSWGWAPFHYGRWQFDNAYGWVWFPDTEWAPAWVVWRRAPGYYGWAPIGPKVSIDVAFGPTYRIPDDRWVFVNERDIVKPDIDRYYVNHGNNVTIIKNTTVINNVKEDNSTHVKYVVGPDKSEVEKNTGTKVNVVKVEQSDKPEKSDVSNGQLRMYKPAVQKTANLAQKPAPKQVVALKDVKPVAQRTNANENNENRPNQENSQPNNNANHPDVNGNHAQPEQHNQAAPNETQQRTNPSQPNGSENVNPNQQKESNPNINQAQPDHTTANPKAQQHSVKRKSVQHQQQPPPHEQEHPVENRDSIPKQ